MNKITHFLILGIQFITGSYNAFFILSLMRLNATYPFRKVIFQY